MNKTKCSDDRIPGGQLLILFLISIAFIALTWGFLPISIYLKVMILCFTFCWIFVAIVTFCRCLTIYKKSIPSWAALIITSIVILLIPVLMQIAYRSNKQVYLNTEPNDNSIAVKITYEINRTGGGGSIGNEWTYRHFINGTSFKSGDIVKLTYRTPFSITSRFVERDGISDIGEATSSEYTLSKNQNYKKIITIHQKVHVVEQGGRRNAGSYADFLVNYYVKRAVPTDMSFWELLLFKNEAYGVVLIIFGIAELLLVTYVLVNGIRKKQADEEADRKRKEEEFIEERKAFIDNLRGRTIRDAAGVPKNIYFVNELPIDNNNLCYGTFTVYCSKSGSCFHQNRGCCSATIENHIFNVIHRYKPCSKCCTKHYEIPKWYKDYIDIKKKAVRYKFHDSE